MPKRSRWIALTLSLLIGVFTDLQAQIVPCAGSTGKEIVACVAAAYPDRLKANVSLIERQANMSFLRDRIIETGRCKLLDLGLNCKRGNCTNLSLDFIALKTGGHVEGIDIASGYDDTSTPLKLQWHTYGPPNYGFPTFKAYGPASCIEPPAPPPPPPSSDDLVALRAEVATLRADLALLHGQLDTTTDALNSIIKQSNDAVNNITTIQSRVYKLEQIPVPQGYTCRVQFGLRCTVTAEVNP